MILLSGDLGRHGVAIMSVREGLQFKGVLESDCAPLADLVAAMLAAGADIHCLRDLTRGGLAAALNEIALDARVGIEIDESAIPGGRAGGRRLRTAGPRSALRGQRGSAGGLCAGRRGLSGVGSHARSFRGRRSGPDWRVGASHIGMVELRSRFGGSRIVDLLSGEQMPRIC